ncbi:ATP-binding protein [Flavobacterium sp. NRK F10]|uniref:sensor histidine kinase n=1 Tax=Flavobacterium sp. NRK F10 TaxID=2954931 RepID=UPI0020913C6B|nr:ATP-binding protein [Flavobacterium sp. NRK F10]MCO6175597.1 ATP-binding protein [Flavobacterium sp. NRK F10]
MPLNLIKKKFELYDLAPFYICVTNSIGEILYSNKKEVGINSQEGSLNVYNCIQSLFRESYPLINKKLRTILNSQNTISEAVELLEKDTLLKNIFSVKQVDEELIVFFFKTQEEESQNNLPVFLDSLVNETAEGVICYTITGEIVVWNLEAEKLFGIKGSELIGKKITEVALDIPVLSEDNVLSEIIKLKQSEAAIIEKEIKIGERYVKISAKLIHDKANEVIGVSKCFSDVTRYVTDSQLLQKHVENLQYLNDIWESLSQNLDVQNILQIVTDVTTKFSGAAYGAFFYNSLTEDGEAMKLFTLSGARREDFMKLGMPRNTDIFKKTFNSKEGFIANDVTKHYDFGKNSPHNGLPKGHLPVRSYMSIPVVSMTGENMGSLLFGHPEPGKFSQEHIKMMQSIASQAAVALENSKLLENVKTLSDKKDLFITVVGHELRSPLTTIKGFIQVLSEVNQDNDLCIYIEKVLEQVEALNLLVSDLLDIGQIEAGKISLEKSEFCLSDLVKNTIETVLYAQNTHEILFDNKGPMIVTADKRRIQQVLYNLIYNAVKYSPDADKVLVQIKSEKDEVIVKIIDYGIGISEKHIHNIFDRFYRVPSKKNISGIGIGLFLCSKIIKKHGGTLSVNSVLDEGSEFIFKIPQKNV